MSASLESPAAARLAAWLDGLPPAALSALARRYAEASAAGGATMHKPDGRVLPIPPLLTPEILDTAQLAAVERNANAVTRGLSRLTRWLFGEGAHDGGRALGADLGARLFRAFGGYEREALSTWREAERLCTVRVDYLIDEGGAPHALEVNATIPAMQGYSDIVAGAFLREVGVELLGDRARAEALAVRLQDENGRNADQLLASLLAHDRLLDTLSGPRPGTRPDGPRRIVLVARPGDSQLGELRHLAARWSALGHPARLVTPDELHLDARGDLRAGVGGSDAGEVPDLVYRHVFARRLDPASDFARACLDPRRHRILNPIASHLEAKAMLGLLSRAADAREGAFAEAVGLPDEIRAEVARSVPWTRLLASGATRGPGGEAIEELVETVAREPSRFVIKKSWDYGGRSVFLGADHDEGAARRAAEVMETGERPLPWDELVRAAAADARDVWVVQEFVSATTRRHLTANDGSPEWKQLYVDLSVYTNLGVPDADRPRGGVTRAALRRIVNLQGGGGLAPLLRADVVDGLLDAGGASATGR